MEKVLNTKSQMILRIAELSEECTILRQANLRQTDKANELGKKYLILKQTLEEIREILCKGRTFYDGYFDTDNLSRVDKAIKMINEVLK